MYVKCLRDIMLHMASIFSKSALIILLILFFPHCSRYLRIFLYFVCNLLFFQIAFHIDFYASLLETFLFLIFVSMQFSKLIYPIIYFKSYNFIHLSFMSICYIFASTIVVLHMIDFMYKVPFYRYV